MPSCFTLRWLLLAVAFVVLPAMAGSPAVGQTGGTAAPPPAAADHVPPDLASPRDTMRTFLESVTRSPSDDDTAASCLDLEGISPDAAPTLVSKLHRILNRIEFVQYETLPGIGSRLKPISGRFFFYPPERTRQIQVERKDSGQAERYRRVRRAAPDGRIVMVRGADGAWRFSSETVAGIDELWDALRLLEVVDGVEAERLTLEDVIEGFWPESMKGRILGVKGWQWLSLVILVVFGLVIELIARFVGAAFCVRIIRRRGGEATRKSLHRTLRPFALSIVAIFWLWAVSLLGLPNQALIVLGPCVRLFSMLALVWAAWRATDLVGELLANKAAATESKFDDLVVPLIRKAVKILIFIFGMIYIAGSLHIEIAPLLTGLGIGGVGFAFAAKDTLENFFGSITVIVDRPFQVGDWVVIGDTEGTVEELGLRSVRIRTFYNSLVTIPTANLVRASVDNYGQRKYRRWTTHLNVTYATAPEKIDAFCEAIREVLRLHPYTRKDYYQVWLHRFGPHSLDILVYMFFDAPDWQTELRERHRLMLDIIRLADHIGVEFAFPTQSLHVYEEGATPADETAQVPARAADYRAAREGRLLAREITANAGWRDRKPGAYRFVGAGQDADLDGDGSDDDSQIESKVGGDAG